MALPPSLAFLRLPSPSRAPTLEAKHHTLELYLDLLCPFSAKLTRALEAHVLPRPSPTPPACETRGGLIKREMRGQ